MPSNIFARGEKFCARVTIRGEVVWLGSYGSREAAERAVKAARGGDLPKAQTVATWFASWPVIAHARRSRSEQTVINTVGMARSFVQRFGRQQMAALDRVSLIEWSLEHPGAVRYARTILADAVWAGLIPQNPLTGVISLSSDLRVDPPTEVDVERMIVRAPAFGLPGAMVGVAAYSGLRLSEVAALEPSDVLTTKTQTRLLVRAGKAGRRRTSLLFRREFAEEIPFRRRVSRRAWDRKSVNRCWVKLREDVGLPEVRFHDLRHFHATWLLDRGASDLDVAVQLGHVDSRGRPNPELVRDRYGHPSLEAALTRLEAVA